MIEVTASKTGYGTDAAEADTPEAAILAAQILSGDIRQATGVAGLVECAFKVDDGDVATRWF